MKKIFSGVIILLAMLTLSSCGKDLSFKGGQSSEVINKFLKAVNEGKVEKAKMFFISALPEKAKKELIDFVSQKGASYEVVGEEIVSYAENLESSMFKEKVQKDGKLFDLKKDVPKIKTALKGLGLSRLFKEKSFLVKTGDKLYLVLLFDAQNMHHVTGAITVPSAIADKLDKENLYASYVDHVDKAALALLPDNPNFKKEEEKKEEDENKEEGEEKEEDKEEK